MTFIGRYEQPWRGLDPDTAKTVLAQVNRHVSPRPMRHDRTLMSWAPLSFYDDMLVYALRDDSTLPAITKYALRRKREIFVLDGTPSPIMAANAAAPLVLTDANIIDYVQFFTSHVWHHGLPYTLVERADDIASLPLMTEQQQMIMRQVVRPARVSESAQAPDAVEVQACFMADRRLVDRRLLVHTDGRVLCAPDMLLVDDLPPQLERSMY